MLPILLVEDSAAIGALMRAKLRHDLGREIVWARSRKETIEAVADAKGGFFAALVDYCLPDAFDGEAIETVTGAGVPTIVFTGNFSAEVRTRIWKLPVVDYVIKDQLNSVDYIVRLLRRLERNPEIAVLIVDDSPAMRKSIEHHLKVQRFRTFTAQDGAEAAEMVKATPSIKLVITDYEMPTMDGFELARTLRGLRSADSLAIIGMSSAENAMLGARFLKCGADDYVTKGPYLVEELNVRASHAIERIELIEATREAAFIDSLTGLRNRRFFSERAPALVERAAGGMRPACVLLDIDHFKKINDTRGHETGDRALQHIAAILREGVLPGDLLARFGGEEFCIIFPDVAPDEAIARAEKLRSALAASPLKPVDGDALAMSASLGVSCDASGGFKTMLARADRALYRAKAAGRNRVCGDLDATAPPKG